MLHVYTASAGSGKTYALTRQYLRLALSSDGHYRRIQAVTFTNKATEEMKRRIISELYQISKTSEASAFVVELSQEIGLPIERLRERARRTLRSILLDYRSFRVGTIDAFFQEVLRSFARELNLRGGYRVELETRRALEEATRAVVSDLQREPHNSELVRWLTGLSIEQMEQGRSPDPVRVIMRLAQELEKEDVKQLSNTGQLPSREQLGELSRTVLEDQNAFWSEVTSIAKAVFAEVGRVLPGVALSNNEQGGLAPFYKILKSDHFYSGYEPYSNRYLEAERDLLTLLKKADRERHQAALLGSQLPELFQCYRQAVATKLPRILSGCLILEHLSAYGLIVQVDAKVKELQASERAILLADTPSLINQIINDPLEVPFIYERLGASLDHYMIDEFQDTSRLQYENFRPLLEECIHRGQECLLVGDAKQSIYRWRGSSSSLLTERVPADFSGVLSPHKLDYNWRSSAEVVNFNNELYGLLATHLAEDFSGALLKYYEAGYISPQELPQLKVQVERFLESYRDVTQRLPEQRQMSVRGAVVVHEYDYLKPGEEPINGYEEMIEEGEKSSSRYTLYTQLPEVIADLQRRGYKPSEIAILVRTNREAAFVAHILDEASQSKAYEGVSFDFISGEALAPTEAVSVNFVMAVLQYIVKPEDTVVREEIATLYRQMSGCKSEIPDYETLRKIGYKNLYEAVEMVIARFRDIIPQEELPYLVKLLDVALSYQQDRTRDIADFVELWEERGDGYRLSLPEDNNKLILMTIHKAKGLEFSAVLLPCLTDDMLPSSSLQKGKRLWCRNPYGLGIPLVPIHLSPSMLESGFSAYYLSEAMSVALDALNLLYVATTRARQELHLWLLPEPSDQNTRISRHLLQKDERVGVFRNMMGFLRAVLRMENLRLAPYYCVVPRGGGYSDLRLPQPKQSMDTSSLDDQKLVVTRLDSYEIAGRIAELREGLAHFDKDSNRHFGSVMHQMLSEINTLADVEEALERATQRGDLLPHRVEEARARLSLLATDPDVRRWFDGSGEILPEVAIVGGEDGLSRPDRVILYPDNSAELVDYKFGAYHKGHEHQVRRYMSLLQRMGYTPVRGYLWYLSGTDAAHSKPVVLEVSL